MPRWKFVLLLIPTLPLFSLLALSQEKAAPAVMKGDLERGRNIFENVCTECHDGYSKDMLIGPGLKGLKEGKLPDGTPVSAEVLLDLINRGPAEMPSFKTRLTEQQKADVVAFVLTL